jgi:predicted ester cyclase
MADVNLYEIRQRQKAANAEKAQAVARTLPDFLASDSAEAYARALSEMHVTIGDQVVEGERVVSRWMLDGSFSKEFLGVAPTSDEVTIRGVTVSEVRADGVKHLETYWDVPALLEKIQGGRS